MTPVRAVTPAVLAALVADLGDRAVDAAAAGGVGVRLGVDAAAPEDSGPLADAVVAQLRGRGRAAHRVRTADFLHRRSVRLEYGAADVDQLYERSVDWAALSREVLDPLVDPGRARWLPRLWDAGTDRPAHVRPVPATPGCVVVVDGPYLLRWELSGGFDAVAHLGLAPAALARRFTGAGDPRAAAWTRYLAECDPAARADLVVRYDHPHRPAVTTPQP